MNIFRTVFVASLLLAAAYATPKSSSATCDQCGTWRWAAKTIAPVTEPKKWKFVNTTIANVWAAPRPSPGPGINSLRVFPGEDTIYTLTNACFYGLKWYRGDQDYHLLLAQPATKTTFYLMGSESADPGCKEACTSQEVPLYISVRNALNKIPQVKKAMALLQPAQAKAQAQSPGVTVVASVALSSPVLITVSGAGFWDMANHSTGAAPNGFELHPMTALSGGTTACKVTTALTQHQGVLIETDAAGDE